MFFNKVNSKGCVILLPYVAPVDGGKSLLFQQSVALREVTATEESAIGRQGRGVGGGEDMMAATVDELCFLYGVASPKEKDNTLSPLREGLDGGVGEGLPSMPLVGTCLMGTYGEGGVEEEYSLLCPSAEVATGGGQVELQVVVNLFDDVDQRGGDGDTVGDGEAEPLCLSWFVIGVLSEDDHLDFVEGGAVESTEDVTPQGIAGIA